MKTLCVYHSRDLDGWMSAAIVKKWFLETLPRGIKGIVLDKNNNQEPKPETFLFMLGWDYGNKIPDLSMYDKVIMVDIAFPKEMTQMLFEKLDINFIWIDHHLSAIRDILGEDAIIEHEDTTTLYNGLRRTDQAACELTWEYFFQDEEMPEIVRLLGRYDCFGHKGTNEEQKVLEFQYAARAYMSNYEDCYNYLTSCIGEENTGIETITNFIWKQGEGIYKYLCTEAKQTYAKAFPIEFTGIDIGRGKTRLDITRKFLCVNQERFNPINFGIDYHKDGYDGFACFWHKDGKWTFNLYNDNGKVDCSVIAKQYGGGGHKGAAGFTTEDIDFYIK